MVALVRAFCLLDTILARGCDDLDGNTDWGQKKHGYTLCLADNRHQLWRCILRIARFGGDCAFTYLSSLSEAPQ